MTRQLDDMQLDAELRRFLQARADDVSRVRDAEAMSRAIATGTTARASGRAFGRATWLVLAAALLAIAAIAAIGVGGLRRAAEADPQGTPTNGLIAYAREYRRAPTDIFLVRDGTEPRQIAGPGVGALPGICPTFSPDGRKLAYGEAGGAVVVLTLDGAGAIVGPRQRLPVPGRTFAPCPTWSPDSQGVAFLDGPALDILWLDGSSTDVRGQVWGLDSAGFPPDHDVAWSPMGDSIALARPSGTWLVPVDGRQARRLDPGAASSVSWAPDGSHVAISRDDSLVSIVSVSGDERIVDLPGGWGRVAWSPTGDVIYTGGVIARSDGSDPHQLADCGFASIMSPDGSRILCALDLGELGYELRSIPASGDGEAITIVHLVAVSGFRTWPTSENFSWQPVFAEASSEVPISTSVPTTRPPSAIATPTPVVASRVAGQGPVVRWTNVPLAEDLAQAFVPQADLRSQTRIAWLGDRFVLADDNAGAVATSSDGRSWALLTADDPQRALDAPRASE